MPIRKQGKLPHTAHAEEYQLEYGSSALEIHQDALQVGQRALIVDDLLATGGRRRRRQRWCGGPGAVVCGLVFLVELGELGGRAQLADLPIDALIRY